MQAQEQHPWGPQDCRDKPAAGSPRRRWAVAVQMSLVWGLGQTWPPAVGSPLASLPRGAPSGLPTQTLLSGLAWWVGS